MKQHLILALAIVILAGLAVFSVDAYHNRPVPKPTETTQQAVTAQKAADDKILIDHNIENAKTVNSFGESLSEMTAARNSVCIQLHSLKQTNPACN